jgi:lactobin A/cerein 7B family class IIb bacteriocin
MSIQQLSNDELDLVSGGWFPLVVLAVKAFAAGMTAAGVVMLAEDLSDAPGHNHYGK